MRRFAALIAMMCSTFMLIPQTANAIPRPLPPILIFPDGVDTGCYFYGVPLHGSFGRGVTITNRTHRARKVVEHNGFFGFKAAPDADHYVRIHAAGGYSARCDGGHLQRLYNAGVRAPRAPSSDSFTVRWADSVADASWLYDVQYRVGTGAWTDRLVQSSERSATFDGAASTTYAFRARATIPTGGTDRWSRPHTVVT
jgi:hypothetical protein